MPQNECSCKVYVNGTPIINSSLPLPFDLNKRHGSLGSEDPISTLTPRAFRSPWADRPGPPPTPMVALPPLPPGVPVLQTLIGTPLMIAQEIGRDGFDGTRTSLLEDIKITNVLDHGVIFFYCQGLTSSLTGVRFLLNNGNPINEAIRRMLHFGQVKRIFLAVPEIPGVEDLGPPILHSIYAAIGQPPEVDLWHYPYAPMTTQTTQVTLRTFTGSLNTRMIGVSECHADIVPYHYPVAKRSITGDEPNTISTTATSIDPPPARETAVPTAPQASQPPRILLPNVHMLISREFLTVRSPEPLSFTSSRFPAHELGRDGRNGAIHSFWLDVAIYNIAGHGVIFFYCSGPFSGSSTLNQFVVGVRFPLDDDEPVNDGARLASEFGGKVEYISIWLPNVRDIIPAYGMPLIFNLGERFPEAKIGKIGSYAFEQRGNRISVIVLKASPLNWYEIDYKMQMVRLDILDTGQRATFVSRLRFVVG